MNNRPLLTRKSPNSIKQYAKVLGEIVWASNFTFGQFEILFCHVVTKGDFKMGRSIWHSLPSDSMQLLILEKATIESQSLSDNMREKIIWSIKTQEKLSQLRNDAVHSATISINENGKQKVVPSDIGTKPTRSNRLRGEQNLISKFNKVRGDILQVGQYVSCLWPVVAGFDALPPLPRKPRLKSVQVVQKTYQAVQKKHKRKR